jgi:thioredoxin-related protein
MKKIISCTLSLIIWILTANAQGIQFDQYASWKQILQQAKQEHKYILVDAYATWCVPCKKMDAETFIDKKAGDYFNEKFIATKVQMDKTGNDNSHIKSWYTEAKAVSEQYKITGYPTILFFSASGEIIGRSVGYRNAAELIADAEHAINTSNTFDSLFTKYKDHKNDSALVFNLSRIARAMGRSDVEQKIAQTYINSLKEAELFDKNNLIFMGQYTVSSRNRGFDLYRKKAKRVNDVLGNDAAEFLVRGIITKEEIVPYVTEGNAPDWHEIEKRLYKKYKDKLAVEALAGERMIYSLDKKDWDNYCKYYGLYYSTAYTRSKFHINNLSWELFEHDTDPAVLRVAIQAMKYDIENLEKDNPNAIDTYANLLYKVGNKEEAIEWEKKALKLSNNREDIAKTLNKMKKGEKTW